MHNSTISVILPVYNVQPFLAQCLDSLVAQTYSPYEIIAINDGSTDSCLEILKSYQTQLPQLKIINQTNQGLSVARNVGLTQASGDFIHFLDSDDFLIPDAYEVLIKTTDLNPVDIILFNAYYHFEGRRDDYLIYQDLEHNQEFLRGTWLRERLAKKLLHMVWLHFYRREFLAMHRFEFIPKRIHEDVMWTTQVLVNANKVFCINTPLIYYRIAERHFSPEQWEVKYLRLIESSIQNAQDLFAYASSLQDKLLQNQLRLQALDGGLSVFHQVSKLKAKQSKLAAKTLIKQYNYERFLWSSASSFSSKRKVLSRLLRLRLS